MVIFLVELQYLIEIDFVDDSIVEGGRRCDGHSEVCLLCILDAKGVSGMHE